jgi:AcrR family transcriptional regulator
VLDQASRQLNAKGVLLGSLAEIASLLGITRSALYGYVEDREDLVFQCYRRSCEISRERLSEAESAASDPFEVVAGFVRNMLDPDRPEAAALSELGCLRPDQQRELAERRGALVADLARIISAGQRDGSLRPYDPEVMAQLILSLVYWLKLAPRWVGQEAAFPKQRLENAALLLLSDGLALTPVEIPTDFVDLASLKPQVSDVFDRQAVAAAKLDRMLATASQLFNHRGVDTTSVDEIAAELRVTKRTIYNHFPDKQALVHACLLRGYRIFTELAEQAARWPGPRSQGLGAAFHANILSSFHPDLAPLRVFSGLPNLSAEARTERDLASARLRAVYDRLLEEGAAEGSLRAVDMRATDMVMAGLGGWVGSSPSLDSAHIALESTRLLLFGLKSAPSR